VSPSGLPGIETARIGARETIGTGIPIKGHPDMNVLGEVLHAAIAVRLIDPEQRVFPDLVRNLLNRKGLKGVVEVDDLLRGITDFTCFVEKTMKPKKVWAEHPMVHVCKRGRWF
jgi:hypothetical protein